MVRMLVTAASKHGATAEIGEAIATALADEGIDVEVQLPERVAAIDDFDAMIIGSGVYAGHWMGAAKHFVERHRAALRQRPVWLFSSGPLGDPPAPAGDPVDATHLVELSTARAHRVFAGKLSKDQLGVAERAIARLVHAPYGDYRKWPEITDWAHEIAHSLKARGITRPTVRPTMPPNPQGEPHD